MIKKTLIIAIGVFAFACNNSADTQTESTTTDMNTDESVEMGSGEEISPQLNIESDTNARLEVDTISSAAGANRQR